MFLLVYVCVAVRVCVRECMHAPVYLRVCDCPCVCVCVPACVQVWKFEVLNFAYVSILPTVDQIYHLASPASPPNYMYNPIKTLKTNTIGTLNMLGESESPAPRLLLRQGGAQLEDVFSGTSLRMQAEVITLL